MARNRTMQGLPLTPGVNVDPVDYDAGIRMARQLGYTSECELMLIEHALMLHARGEEASAERGIVKGLDGVKVDFTSWRAVLAAAVAAGTAALKRAPRQRFHLDPECHVSLRDAPRARPAVRRPR